MDNTEEESRLANCHEYEHRRGCSTGFIVHRLYDVAALQASVCTVHSLSSVPRPRKRAKKIESKPGGGSIACERVQRYCMQSSHLQISIPRMYLYAVYLSPM